MRTVLSSLKTSPVHLPNLIELTLDMVGLHEPLRQYIEVPHLKNLTLKSLVHASPNPNIRALVPSLCDVSFFRSIPELEYLFISDMTGIDEPLVDSLRLYSFLQRLTIEMSPIDKLLPSLREDLKDGAFLPQLMHLAIQRSWKSGIGMDFNNFCKLVRAERPNVDVQGNDVFCPVHEYSDEESSALSSLASEDTEDN
ncbi:hypothetical protein CPB86DRAFT_625999 [Serendipita vermifera]|nr:hypothetical protein CPB86DRAFT_625999 [Serendipita vermifera]